MRSDRIVGTSATTAVICVTITATSAKITETYERTVKISGKMKEPSVMTGGDCARMNRQARLPASSNRIGNSYGMTGEICKAIAGTSELIARIGGRIGAISERIDGRCIGIDRI